MKRRIALWALAAAPTANRIAFARCPRCALIGGLSATDVSALELEREGAARSLDVKLLTLDVNDVADFYPATAALRRERPDALLLGATQIIVALRDRWLAFAAQQRLPMLAPAREFGAMLSYGPDLFAIFQKVAEYVAKILAGAHPGDLPMEQPTKFELVVNLKIAKALGLTIPQSLLLRADEVIQ